MEKVPKKKGRRAIGKRTLLLLLAGCIALAGAGVFFLRSGPVSPPWTEEQKQAMLLDRPEEEIASIAITPGEGAAYPLIRAGDGFILMGQPETALREDVIADMMVTLTWLPAENVLTDHVSRLQGVTLADFGLSPAQARVVVTYTDGEKKELLIGASVPDDEKPQRYCMMGGDDRLFTILTADSVPLLHEMDYLRAFDQPELDGSLLDRIDISGDMEWSLYYTPSGWQMEAPFAYPLAASRTDALLKKIEGMAFEACLGNAGKLNLADYGLDRPALRIVLTQAETVITGETAAGESVSVPVPETRYTLLIGAETGKSGVYALWNGQVFKASNFVMGFWKEIDIGNYLLLKPVNFLVNDLNEVMFTYGGQSHAYEVRMVETITENNQIATDEYGRILYDCAVRRAGEKTDMDAEAFLNWYTRLAALSGDGELPEGYEISGDCEASIVLKNDHLTRTIGFYPYDALHDAMAVDGVALYYVQKSWLEGVQTAP